MSAALEVSGLQLGYGDLTAVWDASFTVQQGRICALVGRNGAGKTTLLSGIAGLLPAKAGTVRLLGEDVGRRPAQARVKAGLTLVQEGRRIFRTLTVRENLELGAFGRRGRGAQMKDVLEEMYTRFPALGERPNVAAGALSGGQQQMLAIAQALVSRPQVLLIDEPSAGLAPVIVDEVHVAIRQLKDEGLTIVLVEQLIEDVLGNIADDVVMLEGGRVVLDAPAASLTVEDVSSRMELTAAPSSG
jgi:branched-chain amino acid transport system ATP-binding protein